MSHRHSLQGLVMLVAAVAFLGLAAPGAQATIYTWDNNLGTGGGAWGTASNWNPATVPTGTDTARFTDYQATTIGLGGGTQTVGTVSVENTGTQGYTLSNGILALSANVLQQAVSVTGTNTINATVSGGALNFAIGGGTLAMNGTVTGSSVTKGGAGTMNLTASNAYTGATTINGGTMILSGANGALSGGGAITVTQAMLELNNDTQNSDRIKDTTALTLQGGSLYMTGSTSTIESAGNMTISGTGLSRVIADSGQTLQVGTLTIANTGVRNYQWGSLVDFSSSGTIHTTQAATNGNPISKVTTFNNGETFAIINASGNIDRYVTGTGNSIVVADGTTVLQTSATTAYLSSNYLFQGSVTLNNTSNVTGGFTANTIQISNTGQGTMTLDNSGRFTEMIPVLFNGTANYVIDATLTKDPANQNNQYGQIAAQVNTPGQCDMCFMNWSPNGSTLTIKGSTPYALQYDMFSGPGKTIWQWTQPFNSPNSVEFGWGCFEVDGGTLQLAWNGNMTWVDASQTQTWVVSHGTLLLSDTGQTTGTTLANLYTLDLHAGTIGEATSGSSTLKMHNAAENVYASNGINAISVKNFDMNGQTVTFTVTDYQDQLTVSSNITNGTLAKAGKGNLILTGSSNFANFTFGAGKLTLGTAEGTSALGTANLTMSSGLTLASTSYGYMTGNVTSSGLIAPGDTTGAGTLSIHGTLTLSSTGGTTLDFSQAATGSSGDLLKVFGAITLNGGTTVSLRVPYNLSFGTYNLIADGTDNTNWGSLSGSNFNMGTGAPTSYSLSLNNGTLQLINGATNYWQGTNNADWTAGGSWSDHVPNTQGETALFVEGNGGAGVNVNTGVIIGTMTFNTGSGSTSFTISGGSAITFDNGSGTSAINLAAGGSAQTISTPITISTTDLIVQSNANGLAMSGAITGTGRKLTLTAGVLTLSDGSDSLGAIGLTGGTLNGAGTVTLSQSADLQNGVLSVALAGAVPVAKSGSGTVLLGAPGVLPTAGSLVMSNGSLGLLANNQSVSSVLLTGGAIGGTGVLTVSGNADLKAGTVAANLAGAMNLTKSATGTVILSGSNGYSGTTTVNNGTLQLGNVNALPSATALTIGGSGGGGTLDLSGNSNSVGSLTMTNGSIGNSTGSGVLTVGSGNADLQVGTVAANLAGPMNLTKTTNASGTVILSGSNGYSGSTTVSTGVLQLNSVNALPAATALTLSGGTLNLQTNTNTVNTFTLSGGTLTGSGSGALNIGTSADLQSGTLNAPLGGAGSVTKSTGSTITLSKANTYGGGTTLSNGKLVLTNTSALGTGGLTLSGGTLASGATGGLTGNVTAGASPHVISPGDSNAVGILNTGSLYFNSKTTLDFSNITSPSNMDKIVSTGSLNFSGDNTATLILPGGLGTGGATITYTLIDAATSGNANASNFSVSGSLPDGYHLVWDAGNNDLNLTVTVTNYWAGNAGGLWSSTTSWAMGNVPNVAGATAFFIGSGSSPAVVDTAITVGVLAYSSTASYDIQNSGGSTLTLQNSGGLNAQITLDSTTTSQTISAPVALGSSLTVTNSSSKSLTLSGGLAGGSNGLVLASGNLILSGASAFSVGSLAVTSGTLAGAGGAVLTVTGNADLQVGTVSVNLAGGMNLTKSAAGTVVLSGSNGYSGSTTVNGGTLQLGNTAALPSDHGPDLEHRRHAGPPDERQHRQHLHSERRRAGRFRRRGPEHRHQRRPPERHAERPAGRRRKRDEVHAKHDHHVPGQHVRRRDDPGRTANWS